ncbi:hypothetical protein [Shimia sagamensis]|uniref:DUF306 domain-containing protein n=1 Tax=Shimia sagamensis TaxID=1566352 RepID=A0ABY1NM66_9RHOB|nr:hypothetical protein [Shimia sagamensis]SMP13396.1 hypothetical protein SAMN06265373_102491 [Shimia sagamensis]
MKAVFTAAALVLSTAPWASAQSILGTWTCARSTADNDAVSNVTFSENGRLDALVNIDFLGLDQVVAAQARYRSDFQLDDGLLSDTPVSAYVSKLTIDGQDARRSEHAETLRQALLEGSDASAKVTFTSENYMILSADKAPINCVRM